MCHTTCVQQHTHFLRLITVTKFVVLSKSGVLGAVILCLAGGYLYIKRKNAVNPLPGLKSTHKEVQAAWTDAGFVANTLHYAKVGLITACTGVCCLCSDVSSWVGGKLIIFWGSKSGSNRVGISTAASDPKQKLPIRANMPQSDSTSTSTSDSDSDSASDSEPGSESSSAASSRQATPTMAPRRHAIAEGTVAANRSLAKTAPQFATLPLSHSAHTSVSSSSAASLDLSDEESRDSCEAGEGPATPVRGSSPLSNPVHTSIPTAAATLPGLAQVQLKATPAAEEGCEAFQPTSVPLSPSVPAPLPALLAALPGLWSEEPEVISAVDRGHIESLRASKPQDHSPRSPLTSAPALPHLWCQEADDVPSEDIPAGTAGTAVRASMPLSYSAPSSPPVAIAALPPHPDEVQAFSED